MAFRLHRGKTKTIWLKKDTTEQVREGSLLSFNLDSGQLIRVGNDSDDKVVGVAERNDTLADSGYIPVKVPVERWTEWEADVDSDGGAADSDVGKLVNIDTTGGNSVNAGDSCGMRVDISDSTAGCFLVTKIVSATKVIGVIAGNLADAQVFDT